MRWRLAAALLVLAGLVAFTLWPGRSYEECLTWASSQAAGSQAIFGRLRTEVCLPEKAKQLAEKTGLDIQAARKAGFSDSEIIDHINRQ